MMAVFVGIFAINYFISFGPLSNTLVERDKRMAGREIEIKKIKNELLQIENTLSQQMKVAQYEASKRFADLRAAAVERQRNLLQDARNKSASQIGDLRESLQKQLSEEKQKMSGEIDSFANLIVERIKISSAPGLTSKTAPRTEA